MVALDKICDEGAVFLVELIFDLDDEGLFSAALIDRCYALCVGNSGGELLFLQFRNAG